MSNKDDGKDFSMLEFLFGGDESAEYMDKDARAALGGLSQLNAIGGLEEELANEPSTATAEDDAPIHAEDAEDYEDEDELIDDAEDQQPAATNGLAAVMGAALQGKDAAEDEDYDFDEDDEETQPAAAVKPLAAVPTTATAPPPLVPQQQPQFKVPPLPPRHEITGANQRQVASSQGVELLSLKSLPNGEPVLSFLELFAAGLEFRPSKALSRVELAKSRSVHVREQQPAVQLNDADILLAAPQELDELGFTLAQPLEQQQPASGRDTVTIEEITAEEEDEQHQQQQKTVEEHPKKKKDDSKQQSGAEAAQPQPLKKSAARRVKASAAAAAGTKRDEHGIVEPESPLFPRLPDQIFDPVWQVEWEKAATKLAGGITQLDISPEEEEQESDQDELAAVATTDMMAVDPSTHSTAQQQAAAGTHVPGAIPNPWGGNTSDNTSDVSTTATASVLGTVPLLRIYSDEEQYGQALYYHLDDRHAGVYPGGASGVTWEDKIAYEGEADANKLSVGGNWFDLNDRKLTFEQVVPRRPMDSTAIDTVLQRTAGTVIAPLPKVQIGVPRGADAADAAAAALARINISKDKEYFAGPKKHKGAAVVAKGVSNAKLAMDLSTIPLNMTLWQMQQWHTPRGLWWPLTLPSPPLVRKPTDGNVVIIFSLAGRQKKLTNVDFQYDLPKELWEGAVQARIESFKDAEGKAVSLYIPGAPPKFVPLEQSLLESKSVRASDQKVHLVATFKDVALLPTDTMDAPPDEANPGLLRPPWAFTKRAELSAAQPGRVVLLEYMEERPPLLARPGMGAKLVTYYRKTDESDTHHLTIRNDVKDAMDKWKVGHVVGLGDDDDSPFLGEVSAGKTQLAVETGLYTAPASPFEPKGSDFLLIRSVTGVMSVREVTGTVTVGQELPMHRIPAPASRDLKYVQFVFLCLCYYYYNALTTWQLLTIKTDDFAGDLEERRMFAYVFRQLRTEQAKYDKKGIYKRAGASVKTLNRLFPNRPESMIKLFLRETCGLVLVGRNGEDELYGLRDGARMPSDIEIRKKLSPEEACALEAAYVAPTRMMTHMHDKFGNVAIEKLRLAAEMLPDDPMTRSAIKVVEQELQTAPWNLTDTFVTAFREGRAMMQLTGAADPTSRGLGYSFVRDIRHKTMSEDPGNKTGQPKSNKKVQGTDADLRRMTTEQARQKLLEFGLEEAEIAPLGRWIRIDLVRQLANAAAADGTGQAMKYARAQKTTLIEQQQQYRQKAQEIFEKQVTVLNNTADEDLGDPDELEAALEAELAAEEGREVNKNKKKGDTPPPEDEARELEEMRAAGLLASGSAPATANNTPVAIPGGSKLPAAKTTLPDGTTLVSGTTRRIRREVMIQQVDGTWKKDKEIIYVGRERPYMLASLYGADAAAPIAAGMGPFGFGSRTIAHRPRELARLGYSAARGRGMWRGSRGGSGRGSGRGRGRGRVSSSQYSPAVGRGRTTSKRQRKAKKNEDYDDLSDVSEEDYLDEDDYIPYMDDEDEGFEDRPKPAPKPKKEKPAGPPKPKKPRAPKAKKVPDFSFDDFDGLEIPAPKPRVKEEDPYVNWNDLSDLDIFEDKAAGGDADFDDFKRSPSPGYGGRRKNDDDYDPFKDFDMGDDDFSDHEGPTLTTRRGTKIGRPSGSNRRYQVARVATRTTRRAAATAPPPPAPIPEFVFDPSAAIKTNEPAPFEPPPFDPDAPSFAAPYTTTTVTGRGGGGGGVKRSRSVRYNESDDDEDYEAQVAGGWSEEDEERTPPPQKKKKKTGGGSTAVGAIFVKILEELRQAADKIIRKHKKDKGKAARTPETYWYIFHKPVIKTFADDYYRFVPQDKEMWLEKVKKKANSGKYYNTAEDFLADVRQILTNTEAYNTPGCGRMGSPHYIALAQGLVMWVEDAVRKRHAEIAAAEQQAAYGGVGAHVGVYGHHHQPVAAVPAVGRTNSRKRAGGTTSNAGIIPEFQVPEFQVPDFNPPPPVQQQQQPAIPEFQVPEFDPAAYGAAPAAPVLEEVIWTECTACGKWRTVAQAPGDDEKWYCHNKPGFSCDTPLEPGADV